jgi:hypothetical protein
LKKTKITQGRLDKILKIIILESTEAPLTPPNLIKQDIIEEKQKELKDALIKY